MSGRFVYGGVHWRISGSDRQAIARLRSEGLKLLGTLDDLRGEAQTIGIHRVYPDGTVSVFRFGGIPIIKIETTIGGAETEWLAGLFMDSGILFLAAAEANYLDVIRQPLQLAAQEAEESWLGSLILANKAHRFKNDNRNGSDTVDEYSAILPYVNVSGRARLLRQAMIGRMDRVGMESVIAMAAIPSFGLMFYDGKYYCLMVSDKKIYSSPLLFRRPAKEVAAIAVDGDSEEKREAYLLSLADLENLDWKQIGTADTLGSPLAYGWNWRWDGMAATITTHVVETDEAGTTATYTARRYAMMANPDYASIDLIETKTWFPRRQTSNVWFPVGSKVTCLLPPLTSPSYPDTVSYNAPLYSFYQKNGTECVVRIQHTYNIGASSNEIVLDPYLCGFGTTGVRTNHASYAGHNYSFYIPGNEEVSARGYGYEYTSMKATLVYDGTLTTSIIFAGVDAGGNACPSGSAGDIEYDNNVNGVPFDYGRFYIDRVDSGSLLVTPKVAVIISPYDCEAVTLLSSEYYSDSGTLNRTVQRNSVPVVYHFAEHDVTVWRYMTTNSSPYDFLEYRPLVNNSISMAFSHAGLQFSVSGTGDKAYPQTTIFLDPTIEQMLDAQVPPVIRQSAGACWFAQDPRDYVADFSDGMNIEADIRSAFTGWA